MYSIINLSTINNIVNKAKDFYDLIDGYLAIVFFAWSIIQFLYYNKLKVYIFITKIFRKWRDTEWELTFSCNIERDTEIFKKIEEVIKDMYKIKRIKKEMNLSNSKIYSLENFLLKISYDDCDENIKEVFIEIPKLKTTYSHAKELLEEIEILFKKISSKLKSDKEIYTMNIRFKKINNPFLGFMIQRLGKDSIKSFMCEIDVNSFMGNSSNFYNQKATIYKEYLNITQKSFVDLKEIASSLLLLK